jgi:Ser/Thr protein kinase RdoA (MazF antagonist)
VQTNPQLHPFAKLDPNLVLDALDSVGIAGNGRLQALNSYENRVYLVYRDEMDGAPSPAVVVKFYRPERWSRAQILEEHAFTQELADAEIPVVPPLILLGETLHLHAGFAFSVSPVRPGRAPEIENPAVLGWLGRFIGRIHAVALTKPFEERPALNAQTFGDDSIAFVTASGLLPPAQAAAWHSAAAAALADVRRAFEQAGEVVQTRLHGDCHTGNVLWNDYGALQGPHFVDFDDCRTGPAVQDLWMLLSGDRPAMQQQLAELLTGYEQFCEFNPRELQLVEALRTLRMLHYSAWLARRWDDPAFPATFDWFGAPAYWEQQAGLLREQSAAMVAVLRDGPLLW